MGNWARLAMIVLAVTALGCATAPTATVHANNWTAPLADIGISGELEALTIPRDYEVHYAAQDAPAPELGPQFPPGGRMLADLEGPGCVLQLWTADAQGAVAVFVDGQPVINAQFASLFQGHLGVFGPPLAGVDSGGFYSFVPIPFRERLQIVQWDSARGVPYYVAYAALPDTANILPFQPRLTQQDRAYFKSWQDAWNAAPPSRQWNRNAGRRLHTRNSLYPNTGLLLYTIHGPGVVTEFEMSVRAHDIDALDKVWLLIEFDNLLEPAAAAPLSRFFANAALPEGNSPGLATGNAGNRMWCRFPMPFASSANFRLLNTTGDKLDIEYWIAWREEPVENRSYFRAMYNASETVTGHPYVAADIGAQGRLAGWSVAKEGGRSSDIAAGRIDAIADGRFAAQFPALGFPRVYEASLAGPAHGVSDRGPGPAHDVFAYRTLLPGGIPFRNTARVEMGHGWNLDHPGARFSSVVYWYQDGIHGRSWQPAGFPSDLARSASR